MTPYYADDLVSIYHGDAFDWSAWSEGDVLVTDPPYGRDWRQGRLKMMWQADDSHEGIVGDHDTEARDGVLGLWGYDRPAIVFGDLMLAPPHQTKQVLIYRKPSNAGTRGAMGGFRRDVEAIYLVGRWPTGLGGRSSVLSTATRSQGNPSSPQGRYDHPHAKPVDLMIDLLAHTAGSVFDPFMGSGSTIVAAKAAGRRAIGIELVEEWCEIAARRCSQEVLGLVG